MSRVLLLRSAVRAAALVAALVLPSTAAFAQAPRYNIIAVEVVAAEVARSGGPLSFSATIQSNSSAQTPSFHWAAYLTTGGTLDRAILLGRFGPISLGAQERSTIPRTVTLPPGVSGIYTIAIVANVDHEVVEYNELDNTAFARSFTDLRPEAPEIEVASVGAEETRLREGERVHINFTLRNAGQVAATVNVTAYLGLHRDLISTADLPLGMAPITVAPGATASGMVTGSVPERGFSGDYTVGVVVDGMGSTMAGVNTFGISRAPLNVYRDTLSFATESLPDATITIPYYAEATATGGNGHYTYRIVSGALAPDLVLAEDTGTISGNATLSGSYPVEIEVASNGLFDRRAFTITVHDTGALLTIVNIGVTDGAIGLPYSQILVAAGGEPPYAWSLAPASGELPPGIMLRPEGALTGVPTAIGSYAFGLTVTDRRGTRVTIEYTLSISPPVNVVVLLKQPAPAPVGEPFDFILQATGGRPPYTWTAVSASPPGMRITPQGHLTGIAEQVGDFPVRVRATDSTRGRNNDTALIQVSVKDDGKLEITTPALLPLVILRAQYQAILEAKGGTPPYTWSVVPGDHLPGGFFLVQGDGQKFPANTGVIRGLTVRDQANVFTVRVEDARGRRTDRTMILDRRINDSTTRTGCSCAVSRERAPTPAGVWASGGIGVFLLSATASRRVRSRRSA